MVKKKTELQDVNSEKKSELWDINSEFWEKKTEFCEI